MKQAFPALLCLLGALAGCEEPDITNVARRDIINVGTLLQLQQETGAVNVEIHGAPWAGAAPEEIAGTLRMPEGPGRRVIFRHVAAGVPLLGADGRLVLHFNPRGKPDSVRDCRAKEPIETRPPGGDGFIVHASFCRGEDWVVKATFNASNVARDDWLAYFLRMQELLGAMFPET